MTGNTGGEEELPCTLLKDVYALVPNNINTNDITYKVYFHNSTTEAPLAKGSVVGGVDFYYNGVLVATEKIITEQEVTPNTILLLLKTSREFLISRFFLIFIIIFVISVLIYFYIDSMSASKKRAYKARRKKIR